MRVEIIETNPEIRMDQRLLTQYSEQNHKIPGSQKYGRIMHFLMQSQINKITKLSGSEHIIRCLNILLEQFNFL